MKRGQESRVFEQGREKGREEGAANVAGPGDRLYPQTAREALLEIRRRAAFVHVDLDVTDFGEAINRVALEGLARTEPINFELSDQLADRLAEAHGVLQRLLGPTREWPISTEITAALALPPDLETIVKRRRR